MKTKIYKTCKTCKAVYFSKYWHHGDKVDLDAIRANHFAWTTRCPACKMAESHRFAGLITITGIPKTQSHELLHFIKEYTWREFEKDCQHRLIEVLKQDQHTWVVTTTNAPMAARLSQKIGEAFDHVDVRASFSSGPADKIRVMVEFLPLYFHRFNYERG